MRIGNFEKKENRKASVVASVAAHVIAIALIASITFSYPIASFFGAKDKLPTERIQYIQVQPRAAAPVGNGSQDKATPPKKALKPAPLLAPSMIPTAIPPIPSAPSVGAISGTGTGAGGAPAGVATGVEPSLPDPRIELRPNMLRLPKSLAEKNDSAVKAIYLAWREAEIEAAAHKGRDPRDWTFEKGGQKYGIDSSYIYLGKFKLPSAILAALPFNTGGVDGRRIIENRNADWIRNDIFTHSQGMSEEDFRAAVKRIRERKDREKREADEAKARVQPIVP
ncbi:MAG: hypothetical protein JOZ54_04535 [Acidobacteria bacterium]|nr:hypothetical protein [Acidobacteriota bacterium]